MQHHKYGYIDIESMLSWERHVYVELLSAYIKEENEKIQQQKMKRR